MEEKSDPAVTNVPVSLIRMEDGAEELMKSPELQPYVRLANATMQNRDSNPALQEIAQIPLEKRYLWRVASALEWAFVDFDDLSIAADLKTLSNENLDKIGRLLKVRPLQFCLLLKTLYGPETMERMMTRAIELAKQVP